MWDRPHQHCWRPVHPRAGGEHSWMSPVSSPTAGSSPRGRGTFWKGWKPIRVERFIPARAGNMLDGASSDRGDAVHPRAGGEHMLPSHSTQTGLGSSPRGRGTLEHPLFTGRALRFIPARAGNIVNRRKGNEIMAVHPRAGGEHCGSVRHSFSAPGSSPRGRGTSSLRQRRQGLGRFIPARAGNICARSKCDREPTVHPRAGGEHNGPTISPSLYVGSSPRGRGTCAAPNATRSTRRFIPARAGNIHGRRISMRPPPVHPRAGGEHSRRMSASVRANGSSPRGRGTC